MVDLPGMAERNKCWRKLTIIIIVKCMWNCKQTSPLSHLTSEYVINHGVSPQGSNNHGISGHRVPQVAAIGTAMRTFVREPDRSPQDVVPCDRLPEYFT